MAAHVCMAETGPTLTAGSKATVRLRESVALQPAGVSEAWDKREDGGIRQKCWVHKVAISW